MRKSLFAAAAVALTFLAGPAPVNAQDQATIYTSPGTATYTPSYYTPAMTYTPSYVTTGIAAPNVTTPFPGITYTTPNHVGVVPTYRSIVNPPQVPVYTPTVQSNGLPFGYYLRSDSYPYYNTALNTYYYQPQFNPGVTNGYYAARYPSAYAPYRAYWFGTPYFRANAPFSR
jgi:hypothetical protein